MVFQAHRQLSVNLRTLPSTLFRAWIRPLCVGMAFAGSGCTTMLSTVGLSAVVAVTERYDINRLPFRLSSVSRHHFPSHSLDILLHSLSILLALTMSKHILAAAAVARLAAAAPQGFDFGAIQAAPTVASGPAIYDGDADASNQTATLYTSYTVNSVATAAAVSNASKRALVERSPQIPSAAVAIAGGLSYITDFFNAANNAGLGQWSENTTIQAGVEFMLTGQGGPHNINGNVENYGSVSINQADYFKMNPFGTWGQICTWSGHDANNGNLKNHAGGSFQLNDLGSISSAFYNWDLHSLNNDGNLQFCGRTGCSFWLSSDLDSTNNGLISFEQSIDNLGTFYWKNSAQTIFEGGSNLYNNGAFRLINVVFHGQQQIYGNGCWQLGKGGVLYLENGSGAFQNPETLGTLSGQSIVFQDSSAVLHLDKGAYSYNSNFGAQIYGFGSGHTIEFAEIITGYTYNSDKGVLNISFFGGAQVSLKIGTGYSYSKFSQGFGKSSISGIYYNAPCPSQPALPSQCTTSIPTCGVPSSTPSSTAKPSSSAPASSSAKPSSSAPASSSAKPSSSAPASSSAKPSSSAPASSSPKPTSSAPATSAPVTSAPATSAPASSSYSPYYPALATSYTTNPALTGTTTSGQACPTQPEAGTYCGFINPEDPCAPQPDGYGPVPTPDTDTAFLAYSPLHSLAQAAPTSVPSVNNTQYTEVFKDLNAATSAQSYLGLYTLKTYDVAGCGAQCDANSLCTAFNIYAERDPSLNPSKNDSTAPTVWGYYCPNPPSMTTFKCTLWGSAIDNTTATNQGEWREDFHVVITASNGYDRTNVATPPDCSAPVSSSVPSSTAKASSTVAASSTVKASSTSSAAPQPTSPVWPWPWHFPWDHPHNCHWGIDAPQYSMGSRFFPGPFNPQVCSDFALAQNSFNLNSGSSQKCHMFNAQYIHKNNKPHGTYCALYTTILDDTWATYTGGYSGNDRYDCRQSWTYNLL
ncbi:Hypothetical protein R9X50_00687400 [Acrodontium crateriforme]|uniref:Hyphally-regulated cell wall protein N-terminal domain-containing protein n=1 Tax=Acrodontium crateriforme TaxID=150365 RepID=A0AAQ3RCE9_9PEZI|nr:Hypothetical protein R9X50_00687400 [Acrodontium crateriforme]